MKYLFLCCADETTYSTMSKSEWDAIVDETWAYVDLLKKGGHFIAAESLQSVETATTVRVRSGKQSITDGPFAETKEQLGGFYLVEVRDEEEAIRLASLMPSARHGTVEVRPVRELRHR